MKYKNIVRGEFIDRPNRFIAHVKVDGKTQRVHVKNTGRCREILTPGAEVYLEKSDNPDRNTAYDLVAAKKGDRLINMDSQAPNKVVGEWLLNQNVIPDITLIRPETTYGNSRFDFYVETVSEKIFIEVKGVTLEKDNVVSFPDAPSERAIKHLEELVKAKKEGFRSIVFFVIQLKDVKYFTPADDLSKEFGDALRKAAENGVEVWAYDCNVTKEELDVNSAVLVDLAEEKTVISAIAPPLLRWYDGHKRVLPWREDPSPYHVWVSEIMLQQTRVEAVKPYYERFMEALPDIAALAKAPEDLLLKLWEGLGYYNRVRNLQKAAIEMEERFGGKMPGTYEELITLKGIGSYTAGAISSIAFGQPNPAVDGNVLRVLSRIRQDDRNISDAKVKVAIEEELKKEMPKDRPGDFNQAMMEIGACVCVPNGAPNCSECPLADLCEAHRAGCECDYPVKETKKKRTIEDWTILVIMDKNKTAIRKRPSKGLLAGLYEFPAVEGKLSRDEVIKHLSKLGLNAIKITPLQEGKHIFSHKEWHMKGYLVRVDELEPYKREGETPDWLYVEPSEVQSTYPIPSALVLYASYLNIRQGKDRILSGDKR